VNDEISVVWLSLLLRNRLPLRLNLTICQRSGWSNWSSRRQISWGIGRSWRLRHIKRRWVSSSSTLLIIS